MFDQTAFGEKLRDIRKDRGFTQKYVAERIGVSGQAVSKWEKGECLPDVYNIKQLGQLYHISVDQLLEDENDEGDSNSPNKNTLWEHSSDWLRLSRRDMWNPEYFAFLVNHVWRIDRPVNVVDFGCGIGYLASLLLPLLPKGSSYTGLDISNILLSDARSAYVDTGWPVEFVEQDLTKYDPVKKYDIAICQTLLIHMPSPLPVLEKMANSVISGGRVICIEPSWAFTAAGTYRHGMEVYSYEDFGVHQKLHDTAIKQGSRDPYIGMKIPALMHDLGLKNIGIRINDKASLLFQEPDREKLSTDRTERRKNRFNNVDFYINAGLNRDEAARHVESILRTEDYENDRDEPLPIVRAMSWLISFGEKP